MDTCNPRLWLIGLLFVGLLAGEADAQRVKAFNLSVSLTGSGSVRSDLPGIDCPGVCTAKYNQGTVVTLSASANSGASFSGWAGACSGTALSCTVTIDANTSVTANFSSGGTTLESLEARIVELETQLERLQALEQSLNGFESMLAGVSRGQDLYTGYDTLYFDGMNVAIRNGAGDSQTINGLGNLIVGYNESYPTYPTRPQDGSHNLIIGKFNSYTGYGGFVGGEGNSISGSWNSVIGGGENSGSGNKNVIVSGVRNTTQDAEYAVIAGGLENRVTNWSTAVTGGWSNSANGYVSSISGGAFNSTNAQYASVSGGAGNDANGDTSSISGGIGNQSPGMHSSVAGGEGNVASGEKSMIAGGNNQRANHLLSSNFGGSNNLSDGYGTTVVGGGSNTAYGTLSVVVGGNFNTTHDSQTTILGGVRNVISPTGQLGTTLVGGDDVVCEDPGNNVTTCGEGVISPVD